MTETQAPARRTLRVIAVAVPLAAIACWSVWTAQAAGGTAQTIPAQGTVSLSNTDVNGPVTCQLARLSVLATATFDATLTWEDDRVDVSSANGEFSCSLKGKTDLTGGSSCDFFVGGGSGRTKVQCVADNVKGTRRGNGLELQAGKCRATWKQCKITSDLTAILQPK